MDSIPTYYGQGYLFSLILWTETVDTIIRVMDRPEFGYLVLYLLLSETFTAGDVVTLYYTCNNIDYPDGLIWAAIWNYGLSQRSVLILGRKIFYINVKFHTISVQTAPLY
mgnify:CR=1 FL=1